MSRMGWIYNELIEWFGYEAYQELLNLPGGAAEWHDFVAKVMRANRVGTSSDLQGVRDAVNPKRDPCGWRRGRGPGYYSR